ncbi:MAG TPA: hypothetical protein PLN54_03625, partial [Flavobacteriales bacterium]|nr:hypothetical protein [Flavobacteriales bacterium]
NHEGTRILLQVVKRHPGVERIIVTSTQFVCEAGYQPKHDLDFKPFTVYGESKRRTEMVTREAGLRRDLGDAGAHEAGAEDGDVG